MLFMKSTTVDVLISYTATQRLSSTNEDGVRFAPEALRLVGVIETNGDIVASANYIIQNFICLYISNSR